jgi:heme exporter protein C
VQWWRTLHQPSSILRPGGPSIDLALLVPLIVNFAGLLLLYAYYVVERIRLERMRQRALALRLTRGRRG